jgi:hypothetical protein
MLNFCIGQHTRDTFLLNRLVSYFGLGSITSAKYYARPYGPGLKAISETVIPFFEKYPLQGTKRLDFED